EVIYLKTCFRYRRLGVTLNPGVVGFCRKRLAEFQVVHIFGLYDWMGPWVGHCCRRAGIPYILEPMGMFRPMFRSIRLKKIYHRLVGRRLIAGAQLLIATSEQEQQELLAGGVSKAKIVIRRNGVELPGPSPETGDFRRRFRIGPDAKLVL